MMCEDVSPAVEKTIGGWTITVLNMIGQLSDILKCVHLLHKRQSWQFTVMFTAMHCGKICEWNQWCKKNQKNITSAHLPPITMTFVAVQYVCVSLNKQRSLVSWKLRSNSALPHFCWVLMWWPHHYFTGQGYFKYLEKFQSLLKVD